MICANKLRHIFFEGTVDIIPEDDNSVFLGFLIPVEAPAGVDAVMSAYTKEVDKALSSARSELSRLALQTLRGFTYKEYLCLFDTTGIKEEDFAEYPIFQSLVIRTEKQRRLFIRSREKTYEAYLNLLKKCTKTYNKFLYSFLYEVHFERTNKEG